MMARSRFKQVFDAELQQCLHNRPRKPYVPDVEVWLEAHGFIRIGSHNRVWRHWVLTRPKDAIIYVAYRTLDGDDSAVPDFAVHNYRTKNWERFATWPEVLVYLAICMLES